MKMKLAVQFPSSAPKGSEGQLMFNAFLRKNMDLVKSPETEIYFQVPNNGLPSLGMDWFVSVYLNTMNDRVIIEGIVQAEKDGFDAVIINCFFDPALWGARQAVDIPVVGLCESAVLLASMMGAQFGIVAISPEAKHIVKENVVRYGLKDKLAGVRVISSTLDAQMAAVGCAVAGIEDFKRVARELIADGAEVLIPGCGVMGPVLRLAPGVSAYPNGLTEVDGVPVLDIAGAAVKMAETLVALKRSGAPWISRKGFYARPTKKALEGARAVLELNMGQGVWRD